MATFRVGQRVRIVQCYAWPDLIGREATIIEDARAYERKSCLAADGSWKWVGYSIRPDGSDPSNGLFKPRASALQPIQPERNQVIPWSECLWQPGNIGEPA